QSSFTTNSGNSGADRLEFPTNLVFDHLGNLWVADSNNNRVLKFDAPFSSGESASLVVGQPDFTTNSSATTQNGLNFPTSLAFDSSGDLWVTDSGNNRVLKFDAPFSSGESASLVVGQPDFTTNSSATTRDGLYFPTSLGFDSSGDLWVTDSGHNRVLMYTPAALTGIPPSAQVVLGQPNFTTNSSAATQNGLDYPTGLSFDPLGNLWVSDAANNRVLNFIAPFSSGENASLVIGQPDFTSNSSATTQNGLALPLHSAFDSSGDLWVSDSGNNRVLKFDAPFSSGEIASLVVGQPDFTTATAATTQDSLAFNHNITFDPLGDLWVADSGNNRVLAFSLNKVTLQEEFGISDSISTTLSVLLPESLSLSDSLATLTSTSVPLQESLSLSDSLATSLTRGEPTPAIPLQERISITDNLLAFVTGPGPSIVSMTASGVVGHSQFGDGDTITIQFSEPTNEPGGTGLQNKAGVDAIFTFSQGLGTNYSGQWINPSTFVITIIDATGNGSPQIGVTTASVNAGANLKSSDGTSIASTSISPPLSGSFGAFEINTFVAPGGTGSIILPSGITASVTLPPTTSTTVSVTGSLTAPTAGPSGSTLGFLGQKVEDISLPSGTCTPDCTFSFAFTSDDLIGTGISNPLDVKIFHDHNNDGDFAQPDETLPTTVTQTSANSFIATAVDNKTSKFAVGGVVPALAILGAIGGNSAPNPPVLSGPAFSSDEFPLIINGHGFKLDNLTNVITSSTFRVGQPVSMKLLIYESAGSSDISGVSLFANLHGNDLKVGDSDTILAYNDGSTTITDPEGFFKSTNVITKTENDKLEVDFNMTFAKPMSSSNLIIRTWDMSNYVGDIQILNAFQVSPALITEKSNSTITLENNSNQTNVYIPVWIRSVASWWHDGKVDDANFLSGIQYMIDHKIIKIPQTTSAKKAAQFIPSWVKNEVGWWSEGQLPDKEIVKSLQYLISQGIIKV
ncbi:MAG: NHL repeat-containing protein, partial [Thaumarchaeota archaeon]|nr:NHL repeat-containing protein [Nitrososphaerota archaeon]